MLFRKRRTIEKLKEVGAKLMSMSAVYEDKETGETTELDDAVLRRVSDGIAVAALVINGDLDDVSAEEIAMKIAFYVYEKQLKEKEDSTDDAK